MDSRTRIEVFVASPGDTRAERDLLDAVVAELNRGVADDRGLVLELVRWETHAWPGVGADAQDVINRQIGNPHIFIGIFWKRLGTPTQRAASGTVEEIERALQEWREHGRVELLVYFNQTPYTPLKEDLSQHTQVLEFRERLTREGVWVADYKDVADFESKVRQHLTRVVRAWKPGPAPPPDSVASSARDAAARSGTDADDWHRRLSAGSLDASLDPRLRAETYRLVAVVGAVLREKGFLPRTVDRVAIILMELMSNIVRHVPDSEARVELKLQTSFLRSITVRIFDSGQGFHLPDVLKTHLRRLAEGEREHGLLRVLRFSDQLASAARSEPPPLNLVTCDVYDVDLPESEIFKHDFVTPVRFEYEFPKILWLGREPHVGWEIFDTLGTAVREGSAAAFLDLYFKSHTAGAPYLAVEVTGHKVSTEVPPGSLATVRAALEAYFRALFEGKRVIFFTHDTDSSMRRNVSDWARAWKCAHFESKADLAERLQKLGAQRLRSRT